MTEKTIRKKIHQYVDEADIAVLEVVYKLLELYQTNHTSKLTYEQQNQLLETSAMYKLGKLKGYSLKEA